MKKQKIKELDSDKSQLYKMFIKTDANMVEINPINFNKRKNISLFRCKN